MQVRLRFRCHHKGENIGWGAEKKIGSVKLSPVMPAADDPAHDEIKAFYNATPSGQVEFGTINQAALDTFEVGKDYYITLEAAP